MFFYLQPCCDPCQCEYSNDYSKRIEQSGDTVIVVASCGKEQQQNGGIAYDHGNKAADKSYEIPICAAVAMRYLQNDAVNGKSDNGRKQKHSATLRIIQQFESRKQ